MLAFRDEQSKFHGRRKQAIHFQFKQNCPSTQHGEALTDLFVLSNVEGLAAAQLHLVCWLAMFVSLKDGGETYLNLADLFAFLSG